MSKRSSSQAAARWGWATAFLGLLPMILIMLGTLWFPGSGRPWWAPYTMLGWVGAMGTGLMALLKRAGESNHDAEVTVDAEHLVVSSSGEVPEAPWTVALAEVVATEVIPGFGARLTTADGSLVDVELDSMRDVERLLTALGIEPSGRRFTTAFEASWLRFGIAVAGVIGLFLYGASLARGPMELSAVDAVTWFVMAMSVFGAATLGMRPPKVTVGADGIDVWSLEGSRFIRFDELASVQLDQSTLTLTLHDGDEKRVRAAAANETQLLALRQRIALGIASHSEAAEAPARLALLDRGERSIERWRSGLDQAVHHDGGYRRQPLARDDLDAILASPKTSAERRIGAALALSALDGEEARPRIRIAANACAEDRTRQALHRIAEDEHEHHAIEEALEADAARRRVERSAR